MSTRHIGGDLVVNGKKYTFGSGGSNGLPPIPYGDYPITPNEMGPWGQSHGAIGINHNRIWDSSLGRYRNGIEMHSGSGRMCNSQGCVAVDPAQWSDLKKQVLAMHGSGGAYLHIGPHGASITTNPTASTSSQTTSTTSNPQQTQYAPVSAPRTTSHSISPSVTPTPIPFKTPTGSVSGYRDVPTYDPATGQYSWPQSTPTPTVPPMDIPLSVPPSMPNNVPSPTPAAIPTPSGSYSDQSFAVPQPTSVPAPQQWQGSDAGQSPQPTDYTQLSPSNLYGQGYDQQGFSIPMSYGGGAQQYFNSVTGTYQDYPQNDSVPTISGVGFPIVDFSQPTANAGGTDMQSFGGDQSQSDIAQNDITGFGGDMSLGADVPSSDSAFLGLSGTNVGGDPAMQDFYAANQQYGEGGWYYDQNGTIQPNDSGTSADASATHQQPVQSPTGITTSPIIDTIAASPTYNSSNPNYYSSTNLGAPIGFGAGSTGGYQGGSTGYGGFQQTAGPMFSSMSTFSNNPRLDTSNVVTGGVDPTSHYGDPQGSGGYNLGLGAAGTLKIDAGSPNIRTAITQSRNSTDEGSPPPPPRHLAHGGAIDLAQWMNRKSGKVPGVDHGRDEVNALLRPGEIVANEGQMAGLKIGDASKLRPDQIRAIRAAHKRKKAA